MNTTLTLASALAALDAGTLPKETLQFLENVLGERAVIMKGENGMIDIPRTEEALQFSADTGRTSVPGGYLLKTLLPSLTKPACPVTGRPLFRDMADDDIDWSGIPEEIRWIASYAAVTGAILATPDAAKDAIYALRKPNDLHPTWAGRRTAWTNLLNKRNPTLQDTLLIQSVKDRLIWRKVAERQVPAEPRQVPAEPRYEESAGLLLGPVAAAKPVVIYVVVSSKDASFYDELQPHFATSIRTNTVRLVASMDCPAGYNPANWEAEQKRTASVFLYLVTPNLIADGIVDATVITYNKALHIPLMLKDALVEGTRLAHQVAAPQNGRLLSRAADRDAWFVAATREVLQQVATLRGGTARRA